MTDKQAEEPRDSDQDIKVLNVPLDLPTHKAVRIRAAEEDTSMGQVCAKIIRDHFSSGDEPSPEAA